MLYETVAPHEIQWSIQAVINELSVKVTLQATSERRVSVHPRHAAVSMTQDKHPFYLEPRVELMGLDTMLWCSQSMQFRNLFHLFSLRPLYILQLPTSPIPSSPTFDT